MSYQVVWCVIPLLGSSWGFFCLYGYPCLNVNHLPSVLIVASINFGILISWGEFISRNLLSAKRILVTHNCTQPIKNSWELYLPLISNMIKRLLLHLSQYAIGNKRSDPSGPGQAIGAAIQEHHYKQRRLDTTDSEPIHGSCCGVKAKLIWNVNNHIARTHGSLLVHTSCTGPILNQKKVIKGKIPVHHVQQDGPLLDTASSAIIGVQLYNT